MVGNPKDNDSNNVPVGELTTNQLELLWERPRKSLTEDCRKNCSWNLPQCQTGGQL